MITIMYTIMWHDINRVCIISKIEIIVQEKMVLVKSRDSNSNSYHDLQARA